MIWILVLVGILFFAIVLVNVMGYENKIIGKAQEKKHKAMFYHALAKLTCFNYKGYNQTEAEEKAIEEFLKEPSEYDRHPIGSYFKLCNENVSMLRSIKLPTFRVSELSIGFTVIILFVGSVVLGVMFS